ncbi:hypothetical protein N9L47_09400 [Rhodobacteraceae bacterium]|nr:hypothetical protein [Paracoccaceae bacterium]
MTTETYVLYLATVAVFFATLLGTSQILTRSNALCFGVNHNLWTGVIDLSANALCHLDHNARTLNRMSGAMIITAAALLGLKDVEAR